MQQVDLYQPMMASRVGAPPLVLRVGVQHNVNNVEGGVPMGAVRPEEYVLLSALPEEIKQRVILAVQVMIAGR